jgi:hypothetical protein
MTLEGPNGVALEDGPGLPDQCRGSLASAMTNGDRQDRNNFPTADACGNQSQGQTAKLARDSFTMPEQDFGLIAVLKERALGFNRPAKESELLRAGLHALQQPTDSTAWRA